MKLFNHIKFLIHQKLKILRGTFGPKKKNIHIGRKMIGACMA